MKIPTISYISNAVSSVLQRFPLTMAAAVTGVAAMMTLIERATANQDVSFLIKLVLTAALGLPLFLCAHIIAEKWELQGPKKWLPALAVVILLLSYFLLLDVEKDEPSPVTMMQFLGLNLTAHLMVAFLPYLDKTPVEDFWEYNKRLFGNLAVSAFYSGVIFAGLAIAIVAVDNLFNLEVDGKIYGHLFVFLAGIVNTTIFLNNFPKEYAGLAESSDGYTPAIKNLSKFILIPIVAIYFLILYAYSIKILSTWELPKGWVGSLVLGFSVAGIFTYLLNYLLVNIDGSSHVKGYRRWFFWVLLPMVVLLFVAIGKRLGDYGVTEPRFFVATAGVWLLITSLYFILSKKDNIKFIPISLAVFVLFSVLGPLNAFRVSATSQTDRLKDSLAKNGMLTEGKAVPASGALPNDEADNIRSILYYLNDFGHLEKLASLFPEIDIPATTDWSTVNKIIESLNMTSDGKKEHADCGFYFQRNTDVAISGFDRMVLINSDDYTDKEQDGWRLTESRTGLVYREEGVAKDTFDLQPYLQTLTAKYDCYHEKLDVQDAIYDLKAGSMEAKLLLEGVTFENGAVMKVNNLNGTILMKLNK